MSFNESDPTKATRALGGKFKRNGYVFRLEVTGENIAANAHLIAAAPELYEALEQALAVHGESYSWGTAAKAALRKARGERK